MKEQRRVTINDEEKVSGIRTVGLSHAVRSGESSTTKFKKYRVEFIPHHLDYCPDSGVDSIRSLHFGSIEHLLSSTYKLAYNRFGYQQAGCETLEKNDFCLTVISVSSGLKKPPEHLSKAFPELNLNP